MYDEIIMMLYQWKSHENGIITIDVPNKLSDKFEMCYKNCASYFRICKCCVFNVLSTLFKIPVKRLPIMLNNVMPR